MKSEQRTFELRCFLESASCASSANMTVDRSLSKIPPPQEKQLQMFLEMGKLDMFRLALDSEEQVPALLCILLHYTSFLHSLLPSLSFFPYSTLFSFIILWIYGSLLFQILFYSSLVSIILPLPSSFLLSGLPHSPMLSVCSPFFFLLFLVLLYSSFIYFISSMAPFVRSSRRPQRAG